MWDYAIPTLLMRAGFSARVPHARVLFHKNHPQNWTAESHREGTKWLSKFIGEPFDHHKFRKQWLDPDFVYDKSAGKYAYNHWQPLHRYQYKDPESAKRWYYNEWLPKIPSYGCNCESHWKDLTEKYPPDFSSQKAFFEWGWARHNDVSREHSKKPQISLEEAYQIYGRPS